MQKWTPKIQSSLKRLIRRIACSELPYGFAEAREGWVQSPLLLLVRWDRLEYPRNFGDVPNSIDNKTHTHTHTHTEREREREIDITPRRPAHMKPKLKYFIFQMIASPKSSKNGDVLTLSI